MFDALVSFLRGIIVFLQTYNGAVTAIATIAISIFTYFLVRVTSKQARITKIAADAATTAADAANRQATSMVAIELPIFVIEDVHIHEGRPRGVEIKFGNHGRTPAIITADCLEIRVAQTLPIKPEYTTTGTFPLLRDQIVEHGGSYSFVRKILLNDDEWNQIIKSDSLLRVYGYLDYLDFMKREHREGYCIAFLPAMDRASLSWVRTGELGYTYSRYKTEDDYRPVLFNVGQRAATS